jgi:hypothetical protein
MSGAKFKVNIKALGFPQDYNFTDDRVVTWKNELDKNQTLTIPSGGSIAVSKKILRSFLANKPKLDTAALRDEIEDDMRKLQNLIDSIQSDRIEGEKFRSLAKQAAKSIETAIDVLQDKKQTILDNIDIEKKLELVKKATSGDVSVLSERTGLKKGQIKDLLSFNLQINRFRDNRQDLMTGNIASRKEALISFYRNTSSPFTNRGQTDNNRYGSGGIKAMERRLSQLKGQLTTDQIGVKKVRDFFTNLIENKTQALKMQKKCTGTGKSSPALAMIISLPSVLSR